MGNDGGDARGWGVFGLTGLVGQSLRVQLRPDDPLAWAVTRQPPADASALPWITGSLPALADPPPVQAIASLGPLDAFTDWFDGSSLAPQRLVVLGSTSRHGKADSPDPEERALARRLADCEARLSACCASRGSALTLLRPTLIWGHGRDQNLSRWVALARRRRWLPLPATARGLRQPIHADEVAAAVLAALRARVPVSGAFDLPGAETLPYDDMVLRSLQAGAPASRLLRLPAPVFRALLRLAGRRGPGPGLVSRLGRDLTYDGAPVRAALGLAQKPFRPRPEDFPA
ncbi:nucleoside-diphosphate sugar epimerase [Arenimonas sp.]|uniref:nucleoside-diphosphate sugar epimerase n=1 Tax=Arenimonas sp. TaxID=1872635 RepID=UPI0035B439A2